MDNKQLLLSDQLDKANQINEDLRPIIIACEKFSKGLNIAPPKSIIKERQGIKYIPISAIETNLDRMFTGLWQTKNMQWKLIANEIVVSLELHVFHPIAKVWLCRCGVGAAQMRMRSGSKITDIDSKIKNALEMDVPHAKADALKNAAKSFGNLFGRNIGRPEKQVTNYTTVILDKAETDRIKKEIKLTTNVPQLAKVWARNKKFHSNEIVAEIYKETLHELQSLIQ